MVAAPVPRIVSTPIAAAMSWRRVRSRLGRRSGAASAKAAGYAGTRLGRQEIDGEIIDFRGTLKMQATVSQAVGGFKSIFLKPFDPLFRDKGAGAVVPIKITGTRKEPKMGIEMGKVLK